MTTDTMNIESIDKNRLQQTWESICPVEDIHENIGICALSGHSEQVAIFKVKDQLYAIENIDPFSNAAVLSRGLVGDLKGKLCVASPIFKQHFCLETGKCLEDEKVTLKTYSLRVNNGMVELLSQN